MGSAAVVSAARLTAAEAKALGVDVTTKSRTTRRTVKGVPYLTICKTCEMEFRTLASEDRHVEATKHARYELVLGW